MARRNNNHTMENIIRNAQRYSMGVDLGRYLYYPNTFSTTTVSTHNENTIYLGEGLLAQMRQTYNSSDYVADPESAQPQPLNRQI